MTSKSSPSKKAGSSLKRTLSSLKQTTLGSFVTGNTSRASDKPQAKRLKPTNGRVETDVLLAIRPVHLANIVSGKKNHEYRRYRLHDGVERLWLYESSDGGSGRQSITHIAVIPPTIRRTPGTVPEEPEGIGNADFNAGLKVSKYGYPIEELYELVRPVTLAEMKSLWGMGAAPMGWRYLNTPLWEDRWGDGARDDKVKRLI